MSSPMKYLNHFFITVFLIGLFSACQKHEIQIDNKGIVVNINSQAENQVFLDTLNMTQQKTSEFLLTTEGEIEDFEIKKVERTDVDDQFGKGTSTIIISEFSDHDSGVELEKKTTYTAYENFPNMLVSQTSYINRSEEAIDIKAWISQSYDLIPDYIGDSYWSFQGSSSEARADWILPVKQGFRQQNYMGMNNSDYGGGIPVLDLWKKEGGIAIGHLSLTPELVSFPVEYFEDGSKVNICLRKDFTDSYSLKPGEVMETLESFVMVHKKDCFKSLAQYSKFMQHKGIKFVPAEEQAYEPVWCAWGYERDFTVDEIIGTLPKVKELGFKWAVLDDGFQIAEGDWMVNRNKFPKGEQQMKDLVKTIHSYGLKAKLWWAPLAIDSTADMLKNNPGILLLNKDGSPRLITWWDSWYMSPLAKETKDHTRKTVKMFLEEWDFDGLKMDGQHMNAVPPDYNTNHYAKNPEEAIKTLPEFFSDIYQTATAIKPNAVIENCPCGCCMSYFNMPYMNQAVSSDPTSSWQIRLKGKVYKALIGKTAYYGDHVELSDGATDFASSFGIGAVLGSKFTWPKDNPKASGKFVLTPEKEKVWKKWITLYNNKMLSKENYLGELYDIGFDIPETHVIQKSDTIYYAFYADNWSGEIELRGLNPSKNYQVKDYFNEVDLGKIKGNNPKFKTNFDKFLLIEVWED